MSESSSRGGVVACAVMGMELALALPLLPGLVAGVALGPLVAAGMLPLGYLASRHLPGLADWRWRLGVGLAGGLTLRLLVPLLPDQGAAPSPLESVLGALWPALVGLGLWARGGAIADAELTAASVRSEFAMLGTGLLVLFALFHPALTTAGPDVLLGTVLLFVLCGPLAVGSARQEAAGSAVLVSARTLVFIGATLPLLAGLVVVALLQPSVAVAFWDLVGRALQVVGALLLLLLQPFFWLLGLLIRPGERLQAPQEPRPALPDIGQIARQQPIPEWLQVLLLVAIGTVILFGVVMVLWLLLAILPGWLRGRPSGTAPMTRERLDGGWDDARALLAGLGRWLVRLATSIPSSLLAHPFGPPAEARAAYRALVRWAKGEGVERRPAETTQQFRARLANALPFGVEAYAAITNAYEVERYGDVPPTPDLLAFLNRCLSDLRDRPRAPEGEFSA